MDPCGAVEKELERVITKFTAIHGHSDELISDVTRIFENLKKSFDEGPQDVDLSSEQIANLRDTISKSKDKLQLLTTEHRDLHGMVSKVGKAIDRNFISDYSSTSRSDVLVFHKNIDLLNKVIAQHFFRHGMDDVAKKIVQETDIQTEDMKAEPYADLHRIYESIHYHELQPALDWATEHSDILATKKSPLEFKLHKLAYLQILSAGLVAQQEAILYARRHLAKFIDIYEKEVQTLMGTLLYLPVGIENSPYKQLIEPQMWVEAADTFIRDACLTLGINKDSPLSVVINTGCTALPALLNLKQVMLSRDVRGIWTGRDELPIEIDLESDHRYHSVFACPILRQQSSDENPPMKLSCGHVISRDALNKLCNGAMLKCPYCPVEQSPTDAKRIYF